MSDKMPEKPMCHECSIKAGAVVPKGPFCVTVSQDVCPSCGETKGIVPLSDYDWPEHGKKHIWD